MYFYKWIIRNMNDRRIAYAWIAGGVMWVAWALSCLLGPGNMDLAGNVTGTDYVQFYAAGTTIRNGESQRLYDFEYQRQLEAEIVGPPFDQYHAFITPPFLAWLYLPFTIFPYFLSYIFWSVSGLLLLWASLRILDPGSGIKTFLYSLTWFPVFAAISFGQNSLLSLFLITLTFWLWRKGRLLEAGFISSFLLYKPQLLIGLLLLWLIRSKTDKQAIGGLLLGSGLITGMSLIFMPEASRDYAFVVRDIVASIDTWKGFPHWHSYTIRTFWLLIFPNQAGVSEALTILASFLILIGYLRFARLQHDKPDMVYAASICLTVMIAPHNMVYDWAILLVPAVIIWKYMQDKRDLVRAVYVTVWIATFISGILTKGQMSVLPFAVQIALPVLFYGIYTLSMEIMAGFSEKGKAIM